MKRLWSCITDNMEHCIYTGSPYVERHHVFYNMGGKMKQRCEKYGFIAPVRPDLHPNGTQAGINASKVDKDLKQRCQRYYEEHYGTREEFMNEFGRNYI